MKYISSWTRSALIIGIFSLTPIPSYAERNCNWHVGRPDECWDFRIVDVQLGRPSPRDMPVVRVAIQNVASADGSGRIRVSFLASHQLTGMNVGLRQVDMNVVPQGAIGVVEFRPRYYASGTYVFKVLVAGGWGNMWKFDAVERSFTVARGGSTEGNIQCAECMNNCMAVADRSLMPSIWRPLCHEMCTVCR